MSGGPFREDHAVGYLVTQLYWYVLIAFCVGLIVGWATCSRIEDDQA